MAELNFNKFIITEFISEGFKIKVLIAVKAFIIKTLEIVQFIIKITVVATFIKALSALTVTVIRVEFKIIIKVFIE